MSPKKLYKAAEFHYRYRWIGLPLLLSGMGTFLFAASVFPRTGDWFGLILSVGCTLIALTSFGINHDSATAYSLLLKKTDKADKMSSVMIHELEEDLSWDRRSTLSLRAHPVAAVLVPWLAVAFQTYVFLRVLCVLGVDFSGKGVCTSGWFGV